MQTSDIAALIERVEKIDAAMQPAPWHVGALYEAIRHVQRNTDVMEDAQDDEPGNLPNRYDGEPLAEMRNLLPEILTALRALQSQEPR